MHGLMNRPRTVDIVKAIGKPTRTDNLASKPDNASGKHPPSHEKQHETLESYKYGSHHMSTLAARIISTCSVGTAALVASTHALATCAPNPLNNNCTSVNELTFTTPPRVFVAAATAENSSGGWDYRYTLSVDNTALLPYLVTHWLLPIAPDAQVSQLSAFAYTFSGVNAALTATPSDAGLKFNIPASLPLGLPGNDRVINLAEVSFHSAYGPAATAASVITLEGTTTSRFYYSSGVSVTESRTGITPSQPSLVSIAAPGSPMALSPVPEASSAALSLIGTAGLMALMRTGRKKPLLAGA